MSACCRLLWTDGFMACPYGTNFVGDIYTGVDWNKVDELTPKMQSLSYP